MEQGFTLIDPTKPQRTRKPFKPKVYWTPKDVMAHYQVSAATVSRWKKKGAPFVGPGKTQRVEPEKMESWFARQQGV
ncbi:helix-turn-helix domain-containing protein [Lacticaseibacillus zeae]|uniref:Helix-turn-helix domain-containing protein n=1 Tax=Lacticaseibacillus zeae TaxID=57037 RepID=A0A5R8M1N9_LACZE|nr:helix-turn-helix domain-containing protein [Lacticaseibacillus zeae]TLF43581.1 helix-turn-helix domain-containing protein [Lacticaseibacillus zeae]